MKPTILFEDKHLIVAEKPHRFPTQTGKVHEPDMVSFLKNYLYNEKAMNSDPYLAVIHRLDQPVRGILVFAKTSFAASELNKQLGNGEFSKHYLARLSHSPEKPTATLTDYLVKDSRRNLSRVCTPNTPNAKKAVLTYTLLEGRSNDAVLADILLQTGRHHQIRVQMANIGCPIIGDTRYNPAPFPDGCSRDLALCAYKLEFHHPLTKKHLSYMIPFNS